MEDNRGNLMECDDVVVEILCRLPSKDLMRCKFVCRAWHRLICEVCTPNPPLSCLSVEVKAYDDGRSWFKHVDVGEKGSGGTLPSCHSSNRLLNSCNGLLLFCSHDGYWYYICNPTTRQCEMLHRRIGTTSATLAFDPYKSPHFKVVGFTPSGETHVVMDVYSSESERWAAHTLTLDHLTPYDRWYHRNMIFLDGTIYCMSGSSHLLCFDLIMVKACRIDLPKSEQYFFLDRGTLGASSGHLCFARFYMNELNVWSLDDQCEGDKWFLNHRVTYDFKKEVPLSLRLHPMVRFLDCYGIHPSSDIIFIGTDRMILSYDFRSNTFKEVARTRGGTHFVNPVYTHVQCLTSFAKSKCLWWH